MDTDKILSKLTKNDYHNKLETILENKPFSEDVKNLLLSCVYKIEAGYKDYETVKQEVLTQKEYLDEILNIIKEKCNDIEIIKDTNIDTKPKYEIERIEGKITLWHPNEKMLLYAIYELDDNQIYVDEKYSLIRTALSELLNKGENINRLEVLRDFNGWNWNTDANEIQNIAINLMYQNLIQILGISFMEKWIHSKEVKDYLELAKNTVTQQFGEELQKEIFDLISKIAINICIKNNEKQKEYLLQEKRDKELEYERITNKKRLLEETSNSKKEALKQIAKIDMILSDKRLLEQEFIKRNEELPEYHKIFSLAHLTEKLEKQRKQLINKIEEENKILEPIYYVQTKTELEEKLDLLSELEKEQEQINNKIIHDSIELQKKIMECIKIKIQKIDLLEKNQKKEELLTNVYKFRYYCYLFVDKNTKISSIPELEQNIKEIKNLLIQKLEENKYINKIAKNNQNTKIAEVLFSTKIINLENITIELQQKEQMQILIYDGNTLEKQIPIDIQKNELNIKSNKKTKIFV